MASGKPIGEFSLKSITATIIPGPAGSLLNQVNWEGTGTGFGATFLTTVFVGGGKGGTFSLHWASYLENGDAINGAGQGTYDSVGKHKWRTANVAQVSDGRRITAEGEIDLASRSWKGKLFEAN
jgi:hypothetical protein